MNKLLTFLLLLSAFAAKAQLDTRFYIPPIMDFTDQTMELIVTTPYPTSSVNIKTPDGTTFNGNFTIGAGAPLIWTPPTLAATVTATTLAQTGLIDPTRANMVLNNTGFILTASTPVSVVMRSIRSNNRDVISMKGSAGLGTNFRVASQLWLRSDANIQQQHFATVMAVEDNTQVTFNFPNGLFGVTSPHTVTLNAGEVYLVRTTNALNFITGAQITSNRLISVTCGGNHLNQVTTGALDDGIDNIFPIEKLRSDYVIVRGGGGFGGTPSRSAEYFSVVAVTNGTTVSINGVVVATLNAGQYYTYEFPVGSQFGDAVSCTTSSPAYVYQFSSGDTSNEMGMAIIPGLICTGSTRIEFTRITGLINTITLVVPDAALSSLTLNGTNYASLPAGAVTFRTAPAPYANFRAITINLSFNDPFFNGVNRFVAESSVPIQLGQAAVQRGATGGYGYLSSVRNPDLFFANVSAACPGSNNGQADVTIAQASVPPYTYLWSNGQTTQRATGLGEGTYSVTVSDASGCTNSAPVAIVEALPVVANMVGATNIICGLPLDLTASVTSGIPPYTFSWTGPNGFTSSSQTVNRNPTEVYMAGVYSCTITSFENCATVLNATVTLNNCLEVCNNGIDDDGDGLTDGGDNDCLFICATPGNDGPTSASPPINTYFPTPSNLSLVPGSVSITLGAVPGTDPYGNSFGTTPIAPGDLLMLIQVQDAEINIANSSAYGSGSSTSGPDALGGTGLTGLNNSGLYEFVVATNAVPLTGGTLTFRGNGTAGGTRFAYTNAAGTATRGQRAFQVVRVPQFSSLTLSQNITTPPWNGRVGGLIAFDVAGDFNFNGFTIDASAKGFRGGYQLVQGSGCNTDATYSTLTSSRSSGKGEGVAGTPQYMWDGFNAVDNGATWNGLPGGDFGKGAPANGGGGGNDHNCGGGGGGNGGPGGNGGLGWQGAGACASELGNPGGGRMGSSILTSPNRLVMGGGGGGGDANNATNGTKGGPGGGVVLINAGRVVGNGSIISNGGIGDRGTFAGAPDGAGGGGAGGSIVLNVVNNSPTANLTLTANGGRGGNSVNDGVGSGMHGPGGGGGGGTIWYNSTGATVAANVLGGDTGRSNDGAGLPHGAIAGLNGSSNAFNNNILPAYIQAFGATCLPNLNTTKAELLAGPVGSRPAGNLATYTVTITNSQSGGGAGGVQLQDLLPTGFSFVGATATLSGNAAGPLNPVNTGSGQTVTLGTYNMPGGSNVVFRITARIAGTVAPGIYHNSAQAIYLDPTRVLSSPTRTITASTNAFPGTNTTYQGGSASGVTVPGTNYAGPPPGPGTEDVVVIAGSTATANTPICAGSNLSVSATPPALTAPFTYTWSTPDGVTLTGQNPVRANATLAMGGTYFVTVTDANSFFSTASTSVVVNPATVLTTSNAPLTPCFGTTTTLNVTNAGVGSTYLWSGPGLASNNVRTPVATLSAFGANNYFVTVTNPNGCTSTASLVVTVPNNPAPVINGNTQVCQVAPNETYSTSAAFNAYTWAVTGGTIVSGQGTRDLEVDWTTVGAQSISVTVTNANGCTGSATVSIINVNANPAPGVSGSTSACVVENNRTYNTTQAFASYNWSVSGGTLVSGQSTQNVTVDWTTAGSGILAVTVTDAIGCTGVLNTPVNVRLNPTLNIAGASQFCSGSSVTLTSTASAGAGTVNNSSYQWFLNGTSQGVTATSYVATTTGSYRATVANSFGCTATSNTITLSNFAAPTPTVSGPNAGCVVQTNQSYTTSVAFASYQWSAVGGTVTNGTTSSNALVDWTASGAQSVLVTVTDANGCSGTGTFNVSVSNNPSITVTGPTDFCPGSTATLTASTTPNSGTIGASSFRWYRNGTLIPGQNASTLAATQAGLYIAEVDNSAGCTTASNTFQLNAFTLPTPSILGAANGCQTDALQNFSASQTYNNYVWSASNGTITSGQSTQNISIDWTATGASPVRLTVTDANGCTAATSLSVTVNANPTVTVSGTNNVCSGLTRTLTANASAGSGSVPANGYQWSIDGLDIPSANASTLSAGQSGNYSVLATNTNGCTATASSFGFTVNDNPTADFTTALNPIELNDNVTVTYTGTPGSGTVATANWSFGSTVTPATANTVGPHVVAYNALGAQLLCLTITNSNGCSVSQCSTVNVNVATSCRADFQLSANDICHDGGSKTITASGAASTNGTITGYTWNFGATANPVGGTGAGPFNISYGTPGTKIITVTITDSNLCTATAQQNVEVNPNPVPVVTGSNTACVIEPNQTYFVTAPYPAYAWSVGTGGTATSSTTGQILATDWTASGNRSVAVTVTDANGCTGSTTWSVTVNDNPTIAISGPAAVCVGQPNTLTANATIGTGAIDNTSYQWFLAGNELSGSTATTFAATQTGVYTATVEYVNGCTASSANFNFVSNSTPTALFTMSSTNGVVGTGLTATYSGILGSAAIPANGYSWSFGVGANPSTANSVGPHGVTYTSAGVKTICVTVTDANGCTSSFCSDVTITIPTNCNAGFAMSASSLCIGYQNSIATFSGAASTNGTVIGYAWDFGNNGTPATANTVGPHALNYTVGGTKQINLTITDSNGCTAVGGQTISAFDQLNPTITGSAAACVVESNQSYSAAPSFNNYTWAVSGGSITVGQGSQNIQVDWTASGAQNLSLTVSNANGCTASTLLAVTVNANPTVTISGPTAVCDGVTPTITANVNAGSGSVNAGTFQWTLANNPIAAANNNTYQPTASGVYRVTVANSNGCSATSGPFVFTVRQNPEPVVLGDDFVCVSEPNATYQTNIAFTTYDWAVTGGTIVSGQSTQNLEVDWTTAGVRTVNVTVSSSNGCTASASFNVTVNANPTIIISGSGAICNGQTSLITSNTLSTVATYNWQIGGSTVPGNTPTYTATIPGVYGLQITDINGCTASAATINQVVNAIPTVTLSGNAAVCEGNSGSYTTTPAFTSYVWDIPAGGAITSGQGTQNLSVNWTTAGLHNVNATVTDVNGCSTTAQFQVQVNANPTVTVSGPTDFCAGSEATLNATVTNGTGAADGSTFQWLFNGAEIPGATNLTYNASTAGVYTATVSDVNGCSATSTNNVTLNQFTLPTSGFSASPASPFVREQTTFTFTGVQGSAPIATYGWDFNFGADQQYFTGVGPHNVNFLTRDARQVCVSVTDTNGCTAIFCDDITVRVPTNCSADFTLSANAFCQGSGISTISFVGGASTNGTISDYKWDFGLDASPANAITAGPFNVGYFTPGARTIALTITDNNGCTAVSTQGLVVRVSPQVTITPASLDVCFGGTTTLNTITTTDAGASIVTFDWSSPFGNVNTATTPALIDTTTFTLTVTDNFGCSGSNVINVNAIPQITVTNAVSQALVCFGQSATLNITATGGTGVSYTYDWDNGLGSGATVTTPNLNTTTTYNVTVTDNFGCSISQNIIADVRPDIAITLTPTPAAICPGQSAVLSANSTGGSGSGYTFAWNNGLGNGSTVNSSALFNTTAFVVTVTDGAGCTNTAGVTITVNPSPTVTSSSIDSELRCNNTTVTLSASGANTYLWSNAGNTASIGVTTAGTYTVTGTDLNGCTASSSITVTENVTAPTITVTSADAEVRCNNTIVTMTASGADSYVWFDGASTASTTAIAAGVYGVTGTSTINGCTASASFTVTQNTTPPSVAITSADAQIRCNNTTVTLTGNGTVSYLWFDGTTGTSTTVTASGTYAVTGTAANGCTAVATITVTENTTAPTVTIAASPTQFTCVIRSATLTASGAGSYVWSNGATTASTAVTATGVYSVTGTDSVNGCTAVVADVTITEDVTAPTVTVTAPTNQLDCNVSSIVLTAAGADTYQWNDLTTQSSLTVTLAGTYTVVGTQASNGCTASASFAVSVDRTAPNITITATDNTINCATTTSTLTASGADTYTWSTSETTPSITVATAGNYSVTGIRTSNGCSATQSFNVAGNFTVPVVGLTTSAPSITCAVTSIGITATGGVAYQWSNALGNTASVNVTASGIFTVTVTGANGCTSTNSVTIQNNTTAPTVTVASATTQLTCAIRSITLTASGTSTYAWSNGATTASTAVTATGVYSVTGTDSVNGCTAVAADVTITEDVTAPTVTITAPTNQLDCNVNNIVLTAAGADTYQWNDLTTQNGLTVTQAGTYTVVGTQTSNGCTASASFAVSVDRTAPNITITATDNTINCATTTSTLTASGADTYTWSTSETTPSITVATAGNYFVTGILTSNGCSATQSFNVAGNFTVPVVGFTTSAPSITCAVTSVGITATGGVSYQWSNALGNTASVNVTASGVYTVTVTGANGCTNTNSVTIQNNTSAPTVTVSSTPAQLTCAIRTLTLTASGASSYVWSNGATTASTAVTAIGVYTVTGTNSVNGCTAVAAQITVTEDVAAPTVTITAPTNTLDCRVSNITLTANGANTYFWSTVNVLSSINVTQAATYSVTGTNTSNGCTASASFVVTVDRTAPVLTVTASNSTVNCATATSVITASGADAYQWTFGNAATTSITVSAAGNYTVTGTRNSNGCTASGAATIVGDFVTPVAAITSPSTTITCAQRTVTVTASGGVSYAWSNGLGNNASANVTASGVYTVTVTGANGCTSSASVSVSNNTTAPTINLNASATQLTCAVTSVTITASGGINYTWSTGFAGNPLVVNAPGVYNVTGTDTVNGCTAISAAAVTVTQDITTPTVTITAPTAQLDCRVSSIVLTASGADNFTWSNASTQSSILVNQAGTYIAVGTRAINGCTASASFVVTVDRAAPTVTVTPTSQTVNCATPTATITASGADVYTWNSGQTGATINVTATGTYVVVGTLNSNGCSASASAVVNGNFAVPTVTLSVNTATITCGVPTVTVTASGAVSYVWSNALGTNASATISAPGVYSVVATAANGCTATSANVTVSQDIVTPTITATASVTTLDCANTNTTLTAAGGVSYLWSNGLNGTSIVVNTPATYIVTGTAVNGCTSTASVSVSQDLTVPTPTVSSSDAALNCTLTQVTLFAGGGATYRWSNNTTGNNTIVTAAGQYTVTVIAANGCQAVTTINIGNNVTVPTASVTTTPVSCFGGFNGTANVFNFINGVAPYTVRWSDGFVQNSRTNLPSGGNTVTVTDAVGCVGIVGYNVPSPAPLNASVTSVVNISCFDQNDGSITAGVSGGTPGYTFQWDNGGTGASQTGLTDIAYSFTVTDRNGCSATLLNSITITRPTQVSVTSVVTDEADCLDATGAVEATPLGGSPAYSYLWSNGETTAIATGFGPGNAFVTLTDANGCQANTSATLQGIPAFNISVTATSPLCVEDFGTISIQTGLGTSLTINGTVTNTFIDGLSPGVYVIGATNANGCTYSEAVTITPANPLVLTLAQNLYEMDLGDSVRLNATVEVPSRSYTLTWNPVNDLSCITCLNPFASPLQTTAYTATLIDNLTGCQVSATSIVRVKKPRHVFIPTSFTPNGDGQNDYFAPFGGLGTVRINQFIIANRWGEIVFAANNIPPSSPTLGWDGTLNGEPLDPAVFVYYIEISFEDGATETYRGDVTIIK